VFAREEARHSIKQYINATENDALIFVGTGATSAVNLLVNKLKLKSIVEDVKLRQNLLNVVSPE
jgi:selenocysteine lyase/cysteine desulfurase